ncbi:MAG: alpha/beta hydrolase [Spirochaetota bacterium]
MLDYKMRPGRGSRAAVILHGFGASSADLYPLADELDGDGRLTWYFPEAPYGIRYGGAVLGKAWFPRNEQEVASAVEGSYFDRLEDMDPSDLSTAGSEIGELISEVGASFDGLVLGGFSQGAMVAVEAVCRAGRSPSELILFSGSVIAAQRWQEELAAVESFPFFQSHGTMDPILPFEGARRLFSLLEGAGHSGEFRRFDGGHEVPGEVIERVGRRLRGIDQ